MSANDHIESFISEWALTGGSELANTQSFVNGLCVLIGVDPPKGSRTDDAHNDYVFERRVFQKEADGTESFGRIDAYKRHRFVLEAKQGSDADRKAAEQGEADLDIFGQTAAARFKRGTAKRGTPNWSKAMVEARGQAERYAKALPIEHGWPPFLLVTDIGHCIDVYADFSGTGKQYTQFPDAARFRIALDDLRDEGVRTRLATIWTDPLSLDPSKEAARVTREIAGHLAELSKRLEKREQNPTRVADFLMRCLFTMFAEDVQLIPEGSFTNFLTRMQKRPENFAPNLSSLWKTMDKGGLAGVLGEAGETVLRFNGYLFKDTTAIALNAEEIGLLIEAATHKWNHVEPAIFGTLLERALDGKERAMLELRHRRFRQWYMRWLECVQAQGVVLACTPVAIVAKCVGRNVAERQSAPARDRREIPQDIAELFGNGIGVSEIRSIISLLFLGLAEQATGFAK